jgi:CxxC motif-containing protein (DUF1111 family)
MSASPERGIAGWLIAAAASLAVLLGVGFAFAAAEHPARSEDRRLDIAIGRALFARQWVSAPASAQATDGLGPLYNARSCAGCHAGAGRGAGLDAEATGHDGMVLRLGNAGSGRPDPVYGTELQTEAVPGLVPEGRLAVDFVAELVTLADGTAVALRRPRPRLAAAALGPLDPATRLGLRIAPPLVGLGLLERIPEADILGGSGGRPAWVLDPATGQRRLGRFGWKASEPSIATQVGRALALDIGLSSPLYRDPYGDCTAREVACRAMPNGASPRFDGLEVPGSLTGLLDAYVAVALAPPAGSPPDVPGRRLFVAAGCAACHRPSFLLPAADGRAARTIAPYTDLRLHDLGPGLAEAMPEGAATGTEWRTAPLWGLGRPRHRDGDAALLHDGRARSILEAILWHGGEAATARDRVAAMPAADRDALIAFLRSL